MWIGRPLPKLKHFFCLIMVSAFHAGLDGVLGDLPEFLGVRDHQHRLQEALVALLAPENGPARCGLGIANS